MKILLTGANGYIGARLLPILVEEGHEVTALVRSRDRMKPILGVEVIEGDLLNPETLSQIPKEIEAAYYLVHSMGTRSEGFAKLEAACAENFVRAIEKTDAKQVIYLSGLSRGTLASEHMISRHDVEKILQQGNSPVTVLRAGIVIGSGSASFEIIRDLVEKLPLMIGPRWVKSKCQPIAIRDVLYYLLHVLDNKECIGQTFEIGSDDVLTYKEILLKFAEIRGLKRAIITVPLLTPYLSSLWLFFVTSTNFSIAKALVKSLTVDVVCRDFRIQQIIPHKCLTFEEAINKAFEKINRECVISSWKDAMVQSHLPQKLTDFCVVPSFGCLKEVSQVRSAASISKVVEHLWQIGGKRGWYFWDWAWIVRGWMDRCVGGVGLRRGRTHKKELKRGDALDFWRVLIADREVPWLLLYAEMRMPGEAWLEWKIEGDEQGSTVTQTATFRPKGLLGRLYWYLLYPFHKIIFKGLCREIAHPKELS